MDLFEMQIHPLSSLLALAQSLHTVKKSALSNVSCRLVNLN